MTFRPTALERAFELAKSGDYAGIPQIQAKLVLEGYARNQLDGPSLMRQLRALCVEAQKGHDA
jgi:hypothetical protein